MLERGCFPLSAAPVSVVLPSRNLSFFLVLFLSKEKEQVSRLAGALRVQLGRRAPLVQLDQAARSALGIHTKSAATI